MPEVDICQDCGTFTAVLIHTNYGNRYCRKCTFIKEEDKRQVALRERERIIQGKKPRKKAA